MYLLLYQSIHEIHTIVIIKATFSRFVAFNHVKFYRKVKYIFISLDSLFKVNLPFMKYI